MKRSLLGLGFGLVIAMAGISGILSKSALAQSTDDFTISSFSADYYLDKDDDGRSTLKTVERITAVFPEFDQNHGLERALPEEYDGHSTSLRVDSVSDGAGHEIPYSDSRSNDNLVLRVGDANAYVHGEQTYVITYMQRDVTKLFSDTDADEFYWDVNGTGWAQPMSVVSARVHVPTPLEQTLLDGKASCYAGVEGSTMTCPIARQSSGGETVFSLQANNLQAYENVTFAIGFAPKTFAGYQMTWQERMWAVVIVTWVILLVVSSFVALGMLVWMSIKYYKTVHRIKGRGTIVPEYLPPKDTSVLVGAQVLKNAASDVTAQLIDLAVRHYLKIYQTKEKTLFAPPEYEVEIVKDISDLYKEEQQLLKDLFGDSNVTSGSRLNMTTLRKQYALGAKLTLGRKAVQKSARTEYGLYERAEVEARRFNVIGFILLVVGVVTSSPLMVIVSIVAFLFAGTAWPLTQKGVDLRDYLRGLKLYISVAETDRLKMLQSPEGVEKVGKKINDTDPVQLVKLYERVLPYAVLFGIEKEWVKQLGAYYETAGEQPDWYAGNGVFNAILFTSALNSFTTQSSSYSSSTSSSSGGSGGGGFSGGGGGGGGGGGW